MRMRCDKALNRNTNARDEPEACQAKTTGSKTVKGAALDTPRSEGYLPGRKFPRSQWRRGHTRSHPEHGS